MTDDTRAADSDEAHRASRTGAPAGEWEQPAPPKSVRDRLAGVRGRFRSDTPAVHEDLTDHAIEVVDDAGHVALGDLPGDVAEQLRFENAAPRMARSKRLPPEARDALAAIWDDLIADVYDELKGTKRRELWSRRTVERVLERVAARIGRGQRLLIVTGVYAPMPADKTWTHMTAAAAGSGLAAGAAEVAAFASAGSAAAVAVGSVIVAELLETYVAASARTRQYQHAGRSPDPYVVADDIAVALGHDPAKRRAARESAHITMRWLAARALPRTTSRFMRGVVPVAGVALSGGMSARDVHKVVDVPMRSPDADELARMRAAAADTHRAYPPRDAIEGFVDGRDV